MDKPVVYLASANPTTLAKEYEAYLGELKIEIKAISRLLNDLELKDLLTFTAYATETDADDIHNAVISIDKNLAVFHYCGHASQTHFTLTDGSYHQDRFLKLLSGKKPKLVFLNGCSTYGYVEALLDHGVEAVIATSTAVPDGPASQFAIKFYESFTRPRRSLQQAFDEAVSTLPSLTGRQSLYLRGAIPTGPPETPCAWGLYCRNDAVLTWCLLNDRSLLPAEKGLADKQLAYLCGRDEYRTAFDASFSLDAMNRPVQHYLLVGEDCQSPLGLARKLVYEKITNKPENHYNYPFHPEDNRTVYLNGSHKNVNKISFAIYEVLKGRTKTSSYSFPDFLKIPEVQHNEYTLVALKISADDLNGSVRQAIRQFMDQFRPAEPAAQPAKPPYFLFFWNIIYTPKENWFSAFFEGNPVRKILRPFQESDLVNPQEPEKSALIILNQDEQFLSVPKGENELHRWFRNYLQSVPETEREKVAGEVFRSKKIDVEVLEDKLLTLIAHLRLSQTR
ncbi:hypothetical protein GCM10027299_49930 [Larkinella ripae]